MAYTTGQYGPEALITLSGVAMVGATVAVPTGYTATVDFRGDLTITGPPSDSVTYTVTYAGVQQEPVTVKVLPLVSDLVATSTNNLAVLGPTATLLQHSSGLEGDSFQVVDRLQGLFAFQFHTQTGTMSQQGIGDTTDTVPLRGIYHEMIGPRPYTLYVAQETGGKIYGQGSRNGVYGIYGGDPSIPGFEGSDHLRWDMTSRLLKWRRGTIHQFCKDDVSDTVTATFNSETGNLTSTGVVAGAAANTVTLATDQSTSSTTYATIPGMTTTIVKKLAATRLRVQLSGAVTIDSANRGYLRVDVDGVKYPLGAVGQVIGSFMISGDVHIPSLAAGSRVVTVEWRVNTGGPLNCRTVTQTEIEQMRLTVQEVG